MSGPMHDDDRGGMAREIAPPTAPHTASQTVSGADRPGLAWLTYRRPLTAREQAVLQLVAQGLPNREVAARLGITLGTVKVHMKRVLSKLGARSRTEATVRYLAGGEAADAIGRSASDLLPAAADDTAARRYLAGGRTLDLRPATDAPAASDASSAGGDAIPEPRR